MLIIVCNICRNDDLSPGTHAYSFYCSTCDVTYELYEVTLQHVKIPEIEETANDNATAEQI